MHFDRGLRWFFMPAAVLLLFCTFSRVAAAQEFAGPLTLAEAISLARENNPSFLTQQNQTRSAEWEVRSAYGNLLPSVNSSTSFGYTAGGVRRLDSVILDEQPAQLSSRYNLGFSLSLNGSSLLAPSVARAQARAAEQTVHGAAASLESEVTQRYLAVLEARDALEQAERELSRTAEYVRLAEARFEVGAGTQLDIRRAEVQRGQAEVRVIQARNTAANDIHQLSQVLGVRVPDDVQLTDTFELFEPRWEPSELVDRALSGSPSLLASRAQASAANTRARAATSAYLPTLSFSAGLSGFVSQASSTDPLFNQAIQQARSRFESCQRQNQINAVAGLPPDNCTDPTAPGFEEELRANLDRQNRGFPFGYVGQPLSASMSISLPIFTGLNRQRQVEEARINRLNSQYQVRAQELAVEVAVETGLRNLETNYQSALLQQQVRETAEEELRLAEERFRFGVTTSMEVVDAQASLAEAERAEIAAIYAFHRSLALLEANLGQPLER